MATSSVQEHRGAVFEGLAEKGKPDIEGCTIRMDGTSRALQSDTMADV